MASLRCQSARCVPVCPPTRCCPPRCVHREPNRGVAKMCCPDYRPYPSYCSIVRRYSTMTYCPAPSPPRWKDTCRPTVCQPLCYGPVPCRKKRCAHQCNGPCCNPGPTMQPVQILGCTQHARPVC